MTHRRSYCKYWLLFTCLLLSTYLQAQTRNPVIPGAPTTLPDAPQRDTSHNKSNTVNWHDEQVSISFRKLQTEKLSEPDTSIHIFHRKPFTQPWYRNLGNYGGPVQNLFFTPEFRVGPTLGYHVFDVYRFDIDSLNYYNTTKPYSAFSFRLGSKQEQTAEIMLTQNIRPNWNFAVQYRKLTSPGFYKIQRTNHDNAFLTTNYQGRNQHYELYGAMVYNKEQNDENGGITNDSLLNDLLYIDRKTIPVRFQSDDFGNNGTRTQRSAVANTLRDFSVMLQHRYAFGKSDTLYNEDSTRYHYKFTPRFGITHRFAVTTEKYQFKDYRPDSLRYAPFFQRRFVKNKDSVTFAQRWVSTDNRLLLNGFIGKEGNQLQFSAGTGIRTDHFTDEYPKGHTSNRITSNYLTGEAGKEALHVDEWFYHAKTLLYFTGEAAGNALLQAELGKSFGNGRIHILAGFRQDIGNAPYNYTTYQHDYDTLLTSFNKESVTQVYGIIAAPRLKLSGGVRNYIISNYIYLDETQLPAQQAAAFNLAQVWLQKIFTWRSFVLDNELVFQQQAGDAPINVPLLMGRHQLSFERPIFGRALYIATGVEARYHSTYKPAGYAPLFNRFYYQDTYQVSNIPELSVFFNFRIKRFRAYIMADQLQALFENGNYITTPGYPGPDGMIRFGFTWVLIN